MSRLSAYHHGALRAALLEEARLLLAEGGIGAVSVRSVAGRVGVSHAAPYHHFPDKASLMAALAMEGFERLKAAFENAQRDAGPEATERLAAIGRAYVEFAVADPELFRLMFRNDSCGSPLSEPGQQLQSASRSAFDYLLEAVAAGQLAGTVAPADPQELALAAWSGVHGLALLLVDGPLEVGGTVQATTNSVVNRLLDGIRARQDPVS